MTGSERMVENQYKIGESLRQAVIDLLVSGVHPIATFQQVNNVLQGLSAAEKVENETLS